MTRPRRTTRATTGVARRVRPRRSPANLRGKAMLPLPEDRVPATECVRAHTRAARSTPRHVPEQVREKLISSRPGPGERATPPCRAQPAGRARSLGGVGRPQPRGRGRTEGGSCGGAGNRTPVRKASNKPSFTCVVGETPPPKAVYSQSSKLRPSIRANSSVLCVTSVSPFASAVAAISRSFGPIGVPRCSRVALISPAAAAAPSPKGSD